MSAGITNGPGTHQCLLDGAMISCIYLSLSLSGTSYWHATTLINGYFQHKLGVPEFWISLELRITEVLVTTGAMKHAKLQSNRHQQQTNTQLFTRQMPFLSSNQQRQSIDWIKHHILRTCSRQAHTGGLPTSYLSVKGCWLP